MEGRKKTVGQQAVAEHINTVHILRTTHTSTVPETDCASCY